MPTNADFDKGLAAFQAYREAHVAEEDEITVYNDLGDEIESLKSSQDLSAVKCDQLHEATEEAGNYADEWIEFLLGRGPNPDAPPAPAPVDPTS